MAGVSRETPLVGQSGFVWGMWGLGDGGGVARPGLARPRLHPSTLSVRGRIRYMTMQTVRHRYTISGLVQGVGFRNFMANTARGLDLHGYVLNLPDGRVELEAEGPAPAMEELRRAASQGPPGAHVEEIQDLDPTADSLPYPFRTVWR